MNLALEIEQATLDLSIFDLEDPRFHVRVNGAEEPTIRRVRAIRMNVLQIEQEKIYEPLWSLGVNANPDLRRWQGQAVFVDIEERDPETDEILASVTVSGVAQVSDRLEPDRAILVLSMEVG